MAGPIVRLVRRLFGSRNPTHGWVRDASRSLELDLDARSLSGVALGSAFDRLQFLGAARRSKRASGFWEFDALGIVAEVESECVGSLIVVPVPDGSFEVSPYAGTVTIGGRAVSLSWLSREREVIEAFGEPTRRDEDPDEIVLSYESAGQVEREIELTPEGRIKTIAIYSYP